MKKIYFGTIILCAVLIFGITKYMSFGGSEESRLDKEYITVATKNGDVEIPKDPSKIVVLDYGALDIIDYFGLSEKICALPKSNLPNYLSSYKDENYIDIGGIKEFDMEKINEIRPDLIIIEGRQAEYYEELSKIAPTLYMDSDSTEFVTSVKNYVNVLANIFEKEDNATKAIAKIDDKINQVKDKVQKTNSDASILFVSDSSISVFGEKSRYNLIYNEFGFKVNDESISNAQHGQNISYEYLLRQNPNYIFIIDKNVITSTKNITAKQIIENELIKNTNAYRNDNIVYLDSQIWYLSGCGIQSLNFRIDAINQIF